MTVRLFRSNVGTRRPRTITLTLNNSGATHGLFLLFDYHRVNRKSVRLYTLRVRVCPSRPLLLKRLHANVRNIVGGITRSTTRIGLARFRFSQSVNVSLRQSVSTLNGKCLTISSNVDRNITNFCDRVGDIRINVRYVRMNFSTIRVPLYHRRLRNLSISPMVIPPSPRLTMRIIRLFMINLSRLPLMDNSTFVRRL